MPNTKSRVLGAGYESDPIRDYAEAFNRVTSNIVATESVDYLGDPRAALNTPSAKNALRKFFVENSCDAEHMTPSEIEYFEEQQNQLFDNDVKAISEACATNTFNALVGMALPMHKNILMNMVWDKGGIPKVAADSPKIVRTMEIRKMITPDGKEIDMFLDQNLMTKAMRNVNPWTDVELNCGEAGETEIVSAHLNGSETVDHLDIESYISAVKIKDVYFEEGDILPDENGIIPTTGGVAATNETKGKHDVWFRVERLKFTPGYGDIKRQLMRPVRFQVKMDKSSGHDGSDIQVVMIDDVISANIQNDRVFVSSMKGQIEAVKFRCKLDASMRTIEVPRVAWSEITDIVEIGTDEGIATTISPEEVKDVSVLYNINQLTKCMSLMKTALCNRKDDYIHDFMDDSFETLPARAKFSSVFDFAPRTGYVSDHLEWRQKTFWDFFDTQITQMLRVLNDPNMVVSVFGEPDIVRKITPKKYNFEAPSNIGPMELDFSKTVVTSDHRVYNFIGSDKLRNNYELIVTLCPRNTNRITYIIYDYQFYISNEIRNNANPALPQILAFERWKPDQFQPVQGRIKIANPSGLRSEETQTTVW